MGGKSRLLPHCPRTIYVTAELDTEFYAVVGLVCLVLFL